MIKHQKQASGHIYITDILSFLLNMAEGSTDFTAKDSAGFAQACMWHDGWYSLQVED